GPPRRDAWPFGSRAVLQHLRLSHRQHLAAEPSQAPLDALVLCPPLPTDLPGLCRCPDRLRAAVAHGVAARPECQAVVLREPPILLDVHLPPGARHPAHGHRLEPVRRGVLLLAVPPGIPAGEPYPRTSGAGAAVVAEPGAAVLQGVRGRRD